MTITVYFSYSDVFTPASEDGEQDEVAAEWYIADGEGGTAGPYTQMAIYAMITDPYNSTTMESYVSDGCDWITAMQAGGSPAVALSSLDVKMHVFDTYCCPGVCAMRDDIMRGLRRGPGGLKGCLAQSLIAVVA